MMKHLFSTILSIIYLISYGQDIQFKEYSYSEFFQMIAEEKDSVFELSNALVILDEKTDTMFSFINYGLTTQKPEKRLDSIVINQEVKLTNVLFGVTRNQFDLGALQNIVFRKDLSLHNSNLRLLYNSDFYGSVRIRLTEDLNDNIELLRKQYGLNIIAINVMAFDYCNFFKGIRYVSTSKERIDIQFGLSSCQIWPLEGNPHSWFGYDHQYNFWISNSIFHEEGVVFIRPKEGSILDIDRNDFGNTDVRMLLGECEVPKLNISKNHFDNPVFGDFNDFKNSHFISWPQFAEKLIEGNQYGHYYFMMNHYGIDSLDGFTYNEKDYHRNNINHYIDRVRIENDETYYTEKKIRSNFYNYYKTNQNSDYANAVYLEMKDLETERLRHLNQVNPSFDTFFTFKINQFLKIFSAYGTKPSKAIIYSIYVILLFAFIYLFFPNSWDSHGRNRIIDRYTFFMIYMQRKAGIHEVYLEDKKEDMMTYEKFKRFIESSEHEVPKVFSATAWPLYKWAIAGTRLSSGLLKRMDIMKGTWRELPQGKRLWKGILLTGAFFIAIIYDLIIKMLNALMLSINTFTTLGFGEIPIKGLPRYLAIIQGFIGWFMLTIFSVSLISQLLN